MSFFKRYEGLTWYTVFCAICYLQGSILFGLDTGSFGSIQALPSWLKDFGQPNAAGKYVLTPHRSSLMNSLPWIGKLTGCFCAELFIEHLGFKKTALCANLIQIVGVILELTSKGWVQFTVGRIVTYFAVGLCENMVPSYNAEIAPSKHRGLLAGSSMTLTGGGNLWGAGMGQAYKTEQGKVGWVVPVGCQFIPAVLMLVLVPFTVESPRWLISKGRDEQAKRNLDRLRVKSEVESGATAQEIEVISRIVEESRRKDNGRWIDVVRGNIPRRVWIVCTLFIISQMNGNQFVQSYAPTFYKQQGLGGNAFLYNLLGQVVGTIGCSIGLVLLDITGRRPLFIYGSAVVTFLLFLAAGLGLDTRRSAPRAHTIVSCFILLKAFSRISATNCAFLTGAEVGGVRFRKKIMALGTSSDVIAAFLVTFVTPYIMPTLGVNIAWIFGSVAGFGVVWAIVFFPELKGRSLEEVDELFDAKIWAWQFKGHRTEGMGSQLRAIEQQQAAVLTAEKGEQEREDVKV